MNPNGRPKLFKTPDDMQKVIDEYFSECDSNVVQVYDKKKEEVVDMEKPIPYTIEGLCSVLGMTRQTLLNYEKDSEFFDTIKKAKRDILRNQVEAGLIGTANNTMTIFLLKNNHGYSDKQEVVQETTHKGGTDNKWTIEFIEAKDEPTTDTK